MCQHTHAPYKVLMWGWNNELDIPTQIPLCERCKDNWIPQTHLDYIDVGNMSKKEAELTVRKKLGKYLATWW